MVLVYPVAGNDMNTKSYLQNADAKPLNKPMMEWFVKQVFKSKDQTSDPRLNLIGANLTGLPGATVILAEIDPLRSEGHALAKRLEDAGNDVTCEIYDGVTHEFFGMGLVVDHAADAEKLAAKNLKKAFGTDTFF
jgi:acetyl esterase